MENIEWKKRINIEAYGTSVSVRSNSHQLFEQFRVHLPEILPAGWKNAHEESTEYVFSLITQRSDRSRNAIYLNKELLIEDIPVEQVGEFLKTQIRITVAEFSTEFVFLHAGVVGWNGIAIVIPGKSFAGKSTLVTEFVRRGAHYFSDDLTVIDKEGMVHPFPKKISLRGIIDKYVQKDFSVEELGGIRSEEKIPVGYLLLTEYAEGAVCTFKRCSVGEGVMACIANSLSIRQNPKYVLNILNKILKDAIILKSERSEAKDFVDLFFRNFGCS